MPMAIKMTSVIFLVIFLSIALTGPCLSEEDPRDSQSPYGVLAFLPWNHPWNNYHYNSIEDVEKAVRLMQEAGIGFIRMDFLWYDLEPKPGIFDFEWYDQIVDVARRHGVSILGILHYNPRWRSDAAWNAAPDFDAYESYARAVVGHFKDRIKYWEIWNEPDEKTYWVPQDDMKTYTRLLKRIYPALKETDPSCVVVMGGVSSTITVSLKRIYRNGGKDYFDIVNIHPFIDPLISNAIGLVESIYRGVRKEMEKAQDAEKKIWFTEIGCPGVPIPTRENGWWNGVSPTEDEQARWVSAVLIDCLQWEGVEKVFWAFFRDSGKHFNSGVDYFGLVREDFSKKPAYEIYKEIAAGKGGN